MGWKKIYNAEINILFSFLAFVDDIMTQHPLYTHGSKFFLLFFHINIMVIRTHYDN